MSLVLRTIEAFPRGRTTSELGVLLDAAFCAEKRQALNAELAELQRQGLIRLGRDGRWRPLRRPAPGAAAGPRQPGALPDAGGPLVAVPAQFRRMAAHADAAPRDDDGDSAAAAAVDPRALLRYYRAALMSDARGAVAEAVDRYAASYLFVCGTGAALPAGDGDEAAAVIAIGRDSLPDSFREALARREAAERRLAVGWPVAVATRQGVPRILPVGLLSARWEMAQDEFRAIIDSPRIVANPEWLAESGRRPGWSRDALADLLAGDGGEGLEPPAFLDRLRECAAGEIRGAIGPTRFAAEVDPAIAGIVPALGLFLPAGAHFTAAAARDLDALAQWPDARLAATALGPLLGLAPGAPAGTAVPVNVGPLNAEQIRAVQNACRAPLSVVTGPPGTGKSQAIVSMVASTLLAGGSVVVASRNHQALDAVEERLADIAPGVSFTVRTLDPRREIDQGMTQVLKALIDAPAGPGGAGPAPELMALLAQLVQRRDTALRLIEERTALHLRLSEAEEMLELRRAHLPRQAGTASPPPSRPPRWKRILARLTAWRRRGPETPQRSDPAPADPEAAIAADRARLARLPEPQDDPVALTEEIAPLARKAVGAYLRKVAVLDDARRLALRDLLDNQLQQRARDLTAEIARDVVAHRPLWLVSALGGPARIPLTEGLFDLAVFDEASQCDIGSALPILARARRAVIVGDDRQLAFISAIGLAQDRNLMLANGVPLAGTGRFAQGRSSLFDLARRTPGVAQVMLRNQYRSAPAIVEWLNREFYAGGLRPAVDPAALTPPPELRPGIAWTHVPGPAGVSARGANVNENEIRAVLAELKRLLCAQQYDGSVGVITPFRAQVLALEEALRAALPAEAWRKAELRVGTVDSFQGQERDLILFSPVVHAGAAHSAVSFLQRDWRRLNVAISRARVVAHVLGDLDFARSGRITTLQRLAAQATAPVPQPAEGMFDSEIERIVYHALRARGLDPQPQYEIAGRRLDFALFAPGVKLDLELDGRPWHQTIDGNRKVGDLWRDAQLRALGWKVRRFWVDELKRDMERCLDTVERDLAGTQP